MSANIGRIELDLGVNSSGFKSEMNNIAKTAKSSTSGITKAFGKMAVAAAAAFSVSAVINFSKSCLQLGSDLAEVQNVVDVTFGSMSALVNQWAKDAMESYGMSEKVAKEYMGQFGAMSKAFGNTEQMAYDQAAALTGLAGDVASFYNMTTDEAFTKLKAVYTGETEALKSLGVVMTQAALDEYALQQGMGKTTSAMSEQEKVALRLSFVQDRLAGASGDFARTADGWANQTRVLALRFDAIKASLGQGLINVLLPVLRLLNELVALLQVAADAFNEFTTALFGNASTAALGAGVAATEGIAANMESGADAAKAMKKSLAGFDQLNVLPSSDGGTSSGAGTSSGMTAGAAITPAVEGETGKITAAAEKLKTMLSELKGELATALPEFAKVSGIAGLWDALKISLENVKAGLSNVWDAFGGGVKNTLPEFEGLLDSLKNTGLTYLQTASSIYGDVYKSLSGNFAEWTEEHKGELEEAFTNFNSIILTHTTTISDIFGDLYGDLGAWWNESGSGVFDGLVKMLGDVGGKLLEIWNTIISPVLVDIDALIRELWQNNLQPLWNDVLELVTTLGNCLLVLWNTTLSPILDFLIENFGPSIKKLFSGMFKYYTTIIGGIIDSIRGVIEALKGVLNFIIGVFTGDWNKAWDGIKQIFIGLWKSAYKPIEGLFNAIKGWLSTVWTVVNDLWIKCQGLFGKMGTWIKGKVIDPVVNFFAGLWSKLKSGAQNAWTGITSVFSKVGSFFSNTFNNAWTKVKNIFSSGGKVFSGIKDGIVSAFKKIVNGLIDGINKVVKTPFEAINNTLKKIRDFKILGSQPFKNLGTISIPSIPRLASGGYVAANTPQLAVIGDNKREGEIVAPESKIAEAVARGFATVLSKLQTPTRSQSDRPMYLTIKLGEDTFWEGFVDYHNNVVKRTGDSPLLI